MTADAKRRCLEEWDNVNDPPCHPSDKGWEPCELCREPKDKPQTERNSK